MIVSIKVDPPPGTRFERGDAISLGGTYMVVASNLEDEITPYAKAQAAASLVSVIQEAIKKLDIQNMTEMTALLSGMEVAAHSSMAEHAAINKEGN